MNLCEEPPLESYLHTHVGLNHALCDTLTAGSLLAQGQLATLAIRAGDPARAVAFQLSDGYEGGRRGPSHPETADPGSASGDIELSTPY